MTLRSTFLLLLAVGVLIGAAFRTTADPVAAIQGDPPPGEWLRVDLPGDKALAPVGNSQLQRIALATNGPGLVVGNARRVWRSTDGGEAWEAATMPAEIALAASIRSDGLGLLGVGNGRIMRSTGPNAGWNMVRPPTPSAPIMDFAWADPATVWAVGLGVVLRSADSGSTWTPVEELTGRYHAVRFRNAVGVMVGGGGTVLRSTDLGATWQAAATPDSALLRGVAFAGDSVVVAVGSNGTILRSTDTGATWRRIDSGSAQHLRAVAFADERTGVAVGFFGTILATGDGGVTWTPVASGTHAHLLDVAIDPTGIPVAVGYFDTILRGPSRAAASGER